MTTDQLHEIKRNKTVQTDKNKLFLLTFKATVSS